MSQIVEIRLANQTEAESVNWRPLRERKPVPTHAQRGETDTTLKEIIDKSKCGTVLVEIDGPRAYLTEFRLRSALYPTANNQEIRLQTQRVGGSGWGYSTIAVRRVPEKGVSPLDRLGKYFE